MTDNYSSFFITVLKLDKQQRKLLFYSICILVRFLLGLLFVLKNEEVALSYISAIWGFCWLSLIIKQRRWEDAPDVPPWYKGIERFIIRSCFAFVLFLVGVIGIISEEDRPGSTRFIGILIWIELVHGFVDYTFNFK